ncbi:hypothetical protein D1AOALGA4SA_8834 [Olavius algarvensis Delta 1 endosymbiont]|nr:hypothetical protein D1AOALGA4SA_8834 [Olavius algarvensis Delta 1 endosymbiont]
MISDEGYAERLNSMDSTERACSHDRFYSRLKAAPTINDTDIILCSEPFV